MNEAFLHYVWQHQMIVGKMVTVDGQPVVVEKVGELNSDSGPDFVNSLLEIGGVRWSGCVEIHVKSSDWNIHNHTFDKAYNNVILHVVYEHDVDVHTQSGVCPPVIELKRYIPIELWSRYEQLLSWSKQEAVACSAELSSIPKFFISTYLERLAVERLEQKSRVVNDMLEDSKGDWETCIYWLMAKYFGGMANAFPFELLAKNTPLNLLARYKDDRDKIEALLLGQAGLLYGHFCDDYPRKLQIEYEALRKGYGLKPISACLWKFFRMRPSSFPTIRISQFASLLSSSSNLFSRFVETTDVHGLEDFFDVKSADYWVSHYQFDKQSKNIKKNVGRMFADTLIINAWVPLLFVYGCSHDNQEMKDRAIMMLQQLAPEKNKVVNMWKTCGIEVSNAADTQALLQLYNSYCKERRCIDCHIGFKVMNDTNVHAVDGN